MTFLWMLASGCQPYVVVQAFKLICFWGLASNPSKSVPLLQPVRFQYCLAVGMHMVFQTSEHSAVEPVRPIVKSIQGIVCGLTIRKQ